MAVMKYTPPLAALLLLAACSGSPDEEKAPAPTALVSLARVEQGAVNRRVTLYGAAEGGSASKRVLTSPAAAIVARIVAPAGTKVGRGQIVAILTPAADTSLELAKASGDARAADAALARAERLRADGLVSNAEVETARAAARSADATRASLSGRAAGLVLRAPVGGFVDSIVANPGDAVQAGATVATIAEPGDVRARFGVDPGLAAAIHPGDGLRIMRPGGGSVEVPVLSVATVVDPQTRLASLFAAIPAGSGIGVGETLKGDVSISGQGDTLAIPYAALLDDGGQSYVFTVSGGTAHRRDVTIGPVAGDRVAIVKGLSAGDQVVTQGGTALEDGMKVRTK
ncbi:MAG: efflux RND transporter periplasmic adaptor subunit [Sphingomonas sp.]